MANEEDGDEEGEVGSSEMALASPGLPPGACYSGLYWPLVP